MTAKSAKILFVFLALVAIALQIQITILSNEDYIGLRVNLADLLLPFAGVFILVSLIRKKSMWPNWATKHFYTIIIGLISVMSIALYQGYLTNGFLSNWALTNKYIGFYILLSYLMLGGWIVTNTKGFNTYFLFSKAFSCFFIFILTISTIALLFTQIFSTSLWFERYPWDGFMANRNAYMLLTVFTIILIETYRKNNQPLLPSWAYNLFWFLMPFFIMFNGSRAGWIIFGVILVGSLVLQARTTLKKILPCILIGVISCALILPFLETLKHQKRQFNTLMNITGQGVITSDGITYEGDKKRITDIKDGLKLFKESNFIAGAGLGSYYETQKTNIAETRFSYTLDFTALFLLVETGILGLTSFTAFFFLCLYIFYKRGFKETPSAFHQTLFYFLITFVAISILHEIMYTRFIWVFLGLGLAAPKAMKT